MIHDFDPRIFSSPVGNAYWYGAVYTLGFLGVFLWFWFRRHKVGLTKSDVVMFSTVFALGILIGGRIFDILVYEFDYYRTRPLAAFNLWNGGMASHGVLLGGLVATYLFAKRKGIPIFVLLDEIVVPGAFLLAIGRLGNFIEGGVIGSTTALPWGFVYENVEGPRHPVALYESAKNFALIPLLVWAIRIWPPGQGVVVSLFVLFYALLRFFVDLLRDYEAAWLGIGTGQLFNLVMAMIGLVMLIHFLRVPRPLTVSHQPSERQPSLVQIIVFIAVVIYPLGIPTSWTSANIAEKRAASADAASEAEQ